MSELNCPRCAQKHKELCEELTEIPERLPLTLTSETYRGQLAQAQIQSSAQLLGGMEQFSSVSVYDFAKRAEKECSLQ